MTTKLVAGIPFEHRITAQPGRHDRHIGQVEARRTDGVGSGHWVILWQSDTKPSEEAARSAAERWLAAYRPGGATWSTASQEVPR